MSASHTFVDDPDAILIGSGNMSATLAVMLKRLDPRLCIQMVEITSELASEASDGWNNAGTGHAGICELNYTPARDQNGGVPISRALHIFEQFEHSKQFWGSMTAEGKMGEPADFIHAVPHVCFVKGTEDGCNRRDSPRSRGWARFPSEGSGWFAMNRPSAHGTTRKSMVSLIQRPRTLAHHISISGGSMSGASSSLVPLRRGPRVSKPACRSCSPKLKARSV